MTVDAITKFREQVRVAAISKDCSTILSLVDSLRDDVMPELGTIPSLLRINQTHRDSESYEKGFELDESIG